jgi:hypothetical protein
MPFVIDNRLPSKSVSESARERVCCSSATGSQDLLHCVRPELAVRPEGANH